MFSMKAIRNLLFVFQLLLFVWFGETQDVNIQPLLSLLRPENMRSMAELAGELSSMAARNVVKNEKDIQKSSNPAPPAIDVNAKPSQMIGGAFSNIAYQSRNAFLQALDKIEASQTAATEATTVPPITIGFSPPATLPTSTNPTVLFGSEQNNQNVDMSGSRDVLGVREYNKGKPREIRYAEAGVQTVEGPQPLQPPPTVQESAALPSVAENSPQEITEVSGTSLKAHRPSSGGIIENNPFMQIAKRFLQIGTGQANGKPEQLPQFGIRDLGIGADENFGLPKGKGCLPFISEFMQIAYGNCQNVADEKTFDAWGEELKRAILTGEIDLLKASQETCRRGAERQQCDSLREAVANCDVMASLEIGSQLQRAMKRCEDVSGMIDQNPAAVLGQLSNLISGEVGQGFLNNFLKSG